MSVIINDFEVVVEPTPEQRDAAAPSDAPPAPSAQLSPHDIEQVIRRQRERAARVSAD